MCYTYERPSYSAAQAMIESLRQASGTQAQVLALLSLTELQRYKPRLKEQRLWLFVPFMYIAPQ